MKLSLIAVTLISLSATIAMPRYSMAAVVVDFEELGAFTGSSPDGGGSYYNGNDGSGSTNSTGWNSKGVRFSNSYNGDYLPSFDFWSGWSYSNVINSSSPGLNNQYAAYPGGGSSGNGNVQAGGTYAVAFGSGAFFNLPNGSELLSVDVANTTYAALSMRDGDGFAKRFGGVSRNDADFFRITLTGFDSLNAGGNSIGSVTANLADFTFADNSQDYILGDWTTFDLTSIRNARSVAVSFASSDSGDFGINTPTYVAFDNLTITAVPEPSTLSVIAIGSLILGALRFQRRDRVSNR
ncbi:hypothetical protein Pla22_26410 [Rubripirellula amarantea]|uniref:Uncharacterized protein n=1 Tax=Rubripirellula amarantea TaxID=2527999 RepID=A0A5C5WWB5_9BACT|nr:DUF4465 domain-containing protein [Rubripirellula amarantea]TWT54987.1 hypothetical protein Pla22_26410 [Rubripirellula amarantea]